MRMRTLAAAAAAVSICLLDPGAGATGWASPEAPATTPAPAGAPSAAIDHARGTFGA